MNRPSVMMAEMTWPEFSERLREDTVVFLPTGMTEQHGPHLPMGVDHLLPTAIAERVAREVDGIGAPAVNYGYKSMPRSGEWMHVLKVTLGEAVRPATLWRDRATTSVPIVAFLALVLALGVFIPAGLQDMLWDAVRWIEAAP